MMTVSKPACGDVIFTRDRDLEAAGSVLVQWFLDPLAKRAKRRFEHVAIVVGDYTTLESVPLRSEVDIGSWTKLEYPSGLRMIVTGDVLAASLGQTRLAVLRPPRETPIDPDSFDITSIEIASLIGSAYSVLPLKQRAARFFGTWLPEKVARRMSLASPAEDFATKAKITEEFRAKVKKELGYDLAHAPRMFFCSPAVIWLLKRAKLIPEGEPDQTTPTGLYFSLMRMHWTDVTDSHYSPASIKALIASSPGGARAGYKEWQALLGFSRSLLAATAEAGLVDAVLGKFKKI